MKIAFCVPEMKWLEQIMDGNPNDATSILLRYISSGLTVRGHQLSYFAPHDFQDIICSKDLRSVSVVPRSWSKTPLFQFSKKFSWSVQKILRIPYLNYYSNFAYLNAYLNCLKGHDVVYERVNLWSSAVASACNGLNLPYVLFFEADQIFELDYTGRKLVGLQRKRAAEILRYNLKSAQAIICVSEQAKTDLVKRWNVPQEKVVVFNNGVDVELFRSRPEEKLRIRAELGIADNAPLFLFLGSFYAWHDVSTLLEAFCQIHASVPQARLVLIGDGAHRQAMQDKAQELGIFQAVTFTGFVPHEEVPCFISAADVAVVPYPPMKQDLWLSPLKLFEFMASGVAIVASDMGQVSNVIENDVNGLLVPAGDSRELAVSMKRLVTDEALRLRLSKKAREDAEVKYSWSLYFQRMENLFCSLAASSGKNHPTADQPCIPAHPKFP
jgi:glycosyltransferase involved in cell wall biosynthesis